MLITSYLITIVQIKRLPIPHVRICMSIVEKVCHVLAPVVLLLHTSVQFRAMPRCRRSQGEKHQVGQHLEHYISNTILVLVQI